MKRFQALRPELTLAAIAALVVVAAWVQIEHVMRIAEPRWFNDTDSYMRAALYPVASVRLWATEVPPLTPLFFKLMGRDPVAIVRAQLTLSIVSWSLLAVVVATTVRTWWVRPLACALVLAFGMTVGITMWHETLLSDSLSLSLLALLVAAWSLQLQRGDRASRWATVVIGAPYALVRDTNAFALALVALLLALSTVRRTSSRGPVTADAPSSEVGSESTRRTAVGTPLGCRAHRLAIAAAYVAMFLGVSVSNDTGDRWLPAFYSNVSQRVLPYPKRTQRFAAMGMPVSDALMERRGKWAWDDDSAYFNDARLEEFRRWAREHGKNAYARFLLERPGYVIMAPLGDLAVIAYPQLEWMEPGGYSPPLRGVPGLESLLSPGLLPAYLIAGGAMLGFGLARREIRRTVLFRVAFTLMLITYPGVALAWHADPMEIQRHALHFVVLARLGFLLSLVAVFDEVGRRAVRC